jgi:hypothetical protein
MSSRDRGVLALLDGNAMGYDGSCDVDSGASQEGPGPGGECTTM